MVEKIQPYKQLLAELQKNSKPDIGIRTKQPLTINQEIIQFFKANAGKMFPSILIRKLLGMPEITKDSSGNLPYRLNRFFRENKIPLHAGNRMHGRYIAINSRTWND